MRGPGADNLQRPSWRVDVQAEIQLRLPSGDPLGGDDLQRGKLVGIVRRTQMLDAPRALPRGSHDLHRRGSGSGPHRPHVRHRGRLRAPVSA
jgi:hypothetical protein